MCLSTLKVARGLTGSATRTPLSPPVTLEGRSHTAVTLWLENTTQLVSSGWKFEGFLQEADGAGGLSGVKGLRAAAVRLPRQGLPWVLQPWSPMRLGPSPSPAPRPPEGARGASARGRGLRLSLWPPPPQLQQMKETRRLFPDKSVYAQQIGPGLCFGALALMLRFFFEVFWEGVGKEPPAKALASPSLLGLRLDGAAPLQEAPAAPHSC